MPEIGVLTKVGQIATSISSLTRNIQHYPDLFTPQALGTILRFSGFSCIFHELLFRLRKIVGKDKKNFITLSWKRGCLQRKRGCCPRASPLLTIAWPVLLFQEVKAEFQGFVAWQAFCLDFCGIFFIDWFYSCSPFGILFF